MPSLPWPARGPPAVADGRPTGGPPAPLGLRPPARPLTWSASAEVSQSFCTSGSPSAHDFCKLGPAVPVVLQSVGGRVRFSAQASPSLPLSSPPSPPASLSSSWRRRFPGRRRAESGPSEGRSPAGWEGVAGRRAVPEVLHGRPQRARDGPGSGQSPRTLCAAALLPTAILGRRCWTAEGWPRGGGLWVGRVRGRERLHTKHSTFGFRDLRGPSVSNRPTPNSATV